MDSFLLYRDSYSDGKKSYFSQRDIIKDLNLEILFRTMAREDDLISEKVRKIVMLPLQTPEEILYRQEILKDFTEHTDLLNEMYDYAVRQQKALRVYKEEMQKNRTRSTKKTGEIIETVKYLTQGQEELIRLRTLLSRNVDVLSSEGLTALYERLEALPLKDIRDRLRDMDFYTIGGEMHYTLQFGGGLKIENAIFNYCETNPNRKKKNKQGTFQNLYLKYVKKNTLFIDNDEVLQQDINLLTEFTALQMIKVFRPYISKMMSFFDHFIEEISFYMGAVKFMRRMKELNITLTTPTPLPMGYTDTEFEDLYELSMAIYAQRKPVGNTLTLHDNILTLVTGANQGGKSTFLRSYGIAQVMMQCGLPVPAWKFTAPIYKQIFTHFTRREDEQLNSGRLREELQRMSSMINAACENCLFLLNESFASTTEKEGSKIADGILRAFYEKKLTTMMVTHLYQLAKNLYDENLSGTTFLVAERKNDGERTFRMLPGEPSHTSYGTDLFKALVEDIKEG